jgi:hypothetical protein
MPGALLVALVVMMVVLLIAHPTHEMPAPHVVLRPALPAVESDPAVSPALVARAEAASLREAHRVHRRPLPVARLAWSHPAREALQSP